MYPFFLSSLLTRNLDSFPFPFK